MGVITEDGSVDNMCVEVCSNEFISRCQRRSGMSMGSV